VISRATACYYKVITSSRNFFLKNFLIRKKNSTRDSRYESCEFLSPSEMILKREYVRTSIQTCTWWKEVCKLSKREEPSITIGLRGIERDPFSHLDQLCIIRQVRQGIFRDFLNPTALRSTFFLFFYPEFKHKILSPHSRKCYVRVWRCQVHWQVHWPISILPHGVNLLWTLKMREIDSGIKRCLQRTGGNDTSAHKISEITSALQRNDTLLHSYHL